MESLNDSSKLKLSVIKILDKTNKLIKKEMNIKNEDVTTSVLILLSVLNILWSIITLGVTNLKISIIDDFNKTYSLINFIPDVLDRTEPPIIVKVKNNKFKFLGDSKVVSPEVFKQLRMLIITSRKSILLVNKNTIIKKKITITKRAKSS
tara:strand:+ start:279 stop:728 length:450 start_codon:yes stop_codon:yes gene_type:complete